LQSDEDSVKLARALTERRRHDEALAALAALEPPLSQGREALYLAAVNQRCLKQDAKALDTLEILRQRDPRFSRLYEERGLCLAAMNEVARAIESFEHGVDLNAALPHSWSMLERLYRVAGNAHKAELAAEQIAMLRRLPPQIVEAGSLFCDEEMAPAESILRTYLRTSGRHVEALRLLGRIAHQRNMLDDAEDLFQEALLVAPTYRAARADHARVLIDQQKYRLAQEELAGLLRLEPENGDYRALEATAWAGLGQHERAIDAYRAALTAAPGWSHLHVLLGHSLKALGRQREAIASYRAAAASRAGFGDAYWSLANLKAYRFGDEEIERMRTEEAAPNAQPVDRCHLCFSLGRALEDRGEYTRSWHYYERGNALRRARSVYRPEHAESNTRVQIEVCTAAFFAARAGVGARDPAPIFIVGLPRSGSTLIEQILASHSQVEGTRELPDVGRIVRELEGRERNPDKPRYPAVLARLHPGDFSRLGERYLSDTRAYRKGKPLFIDKMPNNFQHVGLIHLLLPDAKIIDVRREPMGCCVSNLKQLFASGQDFSYDLESSGRYYRTYLELMRHWDKVLPGRVLRVHYEDVVEDFMGSLQRLLRYCGLDFEPGCVAFHKTERSVSTASSEQVRQPIFHTGISQWRHYEPWLGPLKDALGDALVRYRE